MTQYHNFFPFYLCKFSPQHGSSITDSLKPIQFRSYFASIQIILSFSLQTNILLRWYLFFQYKSTGVGWISS
jgi:hypothetical protein